VIARGLPLTSFLEELCVQVEHLSPGSLCSILLVDPDGDRFRVGPALIFPGPYNAVLEGLEIDPNYGPCSLAVESRSAIIAADPPRDPRWSSSPWPEVILGYGFASCWSAPIFSSRGDVLGKFAIYKREPLGPRPRKRN
jgi:GAF domain-containing protein